MDLTYYQNFIILAEARTITEAAERICIAQPALSNQLKALESEYGAPLIQTGRGLRSITLTEAGRLFYAQAKKLCQLEDNLRQELSDCVQGLSGTLRLSTSPSRSHTLIHNIIAPFHRDYPQVKFQLLEAPICELEEQLLSGLSEIAIANAPLLRPHLFDIVYRRQEQLYAVCRQPQQLPAKDVLQLSDLQGLTLCTFNGCYEQLQHKLLEENISCDILSISTNRNTTAEWARAGLGIAIIPSESRDFPFPDLCYKPLEGSGLHVYKTIFIPKHKQPSRLAQEFLRYYGLYCYEGTEGKPAPAKE